MAQEPSVTGGLSISLFSDWLARGERGISSEAIVDQLTGVPIGGRRHRGDDHPYDPSDFRRCELLLRQAGDLARLAFKAEMPKRSSVWARLVDQWDDIVAAIDEEVPDAWSSHPGRAKASKAYAMIEAARAPRVEAAS